jgi:hypothetical protein
MEFSRYEESSDSSANRFLFLFLFLRGSLGWVRIRWFVVMVGTFFNFLISDGSFLSDFRAELQTCVGFGTYFQKLRSCVTS